MFVQLRAEGGGTIESAVASRYIRSFRKTAVFTGAALGVVVGATVAIFAAFKGEEKGQVFAVKAAESSVTVLQCMSLGAIAGALAGRSLANRILNN